MRKIFIAAICCTMIASLSWAQNVKSIGTTGNQGYLSIELRDNGSAVGDTATFNDGVHSEATTLWKSNFMLYDGTTTWWADGDSVHTSTVTAGTPTNADAQHFSNTFTFTGNSDLSATLDFVLTQPVANNVSQATYTWTFSNAGSSPISLRVVWLHDGDNYIDTNAYDDDVIGFVDSTNNSLGAIAQGQGNGSGGIDMDSSVLMDTTTEPEALLGLGGGEGPGNWWTDANNWADQNGCTSSIGICPLYVNSIRDTDDANIDADQNDIVDAPGDVGGAIQWAVTVPASGNTQIVHTATWGLDTDVAPNSWAGVTKVADWQLF